MRQELLEASKRRSLPICPRPGFFCLVFLYSSVQDCPNCRCGGPALPATRLFDEAGGTKPAQSATCVNEFVATAKA